MAPQWLSLISAAALLLAGVGPALSQYCGVPGVPGIPGVHGQHGKHGVKGEEGDPGEPSHSYQGQKGMSGVLGPNGRPGLKGDPGMMGIPGAPGVPGSKGQSFNVTTQQVFFSNNWAQSNSVELDVPLAFGGDIVPELEQQLRGLSLDNGRFLCTIKGVYFFTYHISARSRVCLKLMKGQESHMTLCDTSKGFLITSGSVVMELEVGETVSLVPIQYNTIMTTQSGTNIFSGFLIFPTF